MISSPDQIKEIAINFRIENKESGLKVISINDIISVFSDLKRSFLNFVEYKLNHDEACRELIQHKPSAKDSLLKGSELYVLDVKIGSFQAAVAPEILNDSIHLFQDEVKNFKMDTFLDYRNDVVYLDYYSAEEVERIISKYPAESRAALYKPFLETFSENKDYNVILLNNEDKPVRKLIPVQENLRSTLVPGRSRSEVKERLVKAYFYIKSDTDEISTKKPKIKRMIDLEVLEHETYPFKPDTIKFGDEVFVLNKNLVCDVEYIDDKFLITNSDLDIVVWGNTREEAETAFNFSFYSLYKNFAEENVSNLSDKAIDLKQKLQMLVKKHYPE